MEPYPPGSGAAVPRELSIREVKLRLRILRRRIRTYESKYGLISGEFERLFSTRRLWNSRDFEEWRRCLIERDRLLKILKTLSRR